MRINILIAGKAGQGIKKTADVLSKAFVSEGLYVFNHRSYQSLISGGSNFNVLCVSDKKVNSFDRCYDVAILLDEKSFKVHKKDFSKNCIKLHSFDKDIKGIKLDTEEFKKVENIYFLGALFRILSLESKGLIDEIKSMWKGSKLLEIDLRAVEEGYSKDYGSISDKFDFLKKGKKEKNIYYMTGSDAVGIGAIESGLDIYFAYPMTPSTALLTFLAQNKEKYGYLTYQPESEVAVANASLGSSFSGAKTMIGSAGGGFDLMTETLSMQGMTELPLVAYLAMRGGPSSGAATYTSQQDLKMALGCGHGDFPRVVIAPGDLKECYEKTKEAFYLAEKYGLLNIIVSDKHLAENSYTNHIKNYDLFVKKDRKVPGKNFVKKNSYSHDEKGNYTEDPDIIERVANKRKEKFRKAKKEIESKFKTHEVFGKKTGKKLVIGFGSTKGPILDAINSKKGGKSDYKYIHIIYLEPFSKKLINEIEKADEVFVVENNISGQLADLIQEKTDKKIDENHRILKYNSRPFTPKEIIKRLKNK